MPDLFKCFLIVNVFFCIYIMLVIHISFMIHMSYAGRLCFGFDFFIYNLYYIREYIIIGLYSMGPIVLEFTFIIPSGVFMTIMEHKGNVQYYITYLTSIVVIFTSISIFTLRHLRLYLYSYNYL